MLCKMIELQESKQNTLMSLKYRSSGDIKTLDSTPYGEDVYL